MLDQMLSGHLRASKRRLRAIDDKGLDALGEHVLKGLRRIHTHQGESVNLAHRQSIDLSPLAAQVPPAAAHDQLIPSCCRAFGDRLGDLCEVGHAQIRDNQADQV